MSSQFATIAKTVQSHKDALDRYRKENEKLVARVQRLEFQNTQLANGSLSTAYLSNHEVNIITVTEIDGDGAWGNAFGNINSVKTSKVRVFGGGDYGFYFPLEVGSTGLGVFIGLHTDTDGTKYRSFHLIIGTVLLRSIPTPCTIVAPPDANGYVLQPDWGGGNFYASGFWNKYGSDLFDVVPNGTRVVAFISLGGNNNFFI